MITRLNLIANQELFHAVSITKHIYHGVTKLIISYNRSISTSNLKGVSVRFALALKFENSNTNTVLQIIVYWCEQHLTAHLMEFEKDDTENSFRVLHQTYTISNCKIR